MLDPREVEEILRELEASRRALEKQNDEIRTALRDGQREITQRLDTLNGSVTDIMAEIGDVPDMRYRDPGRQTLRSRLHTVEDRVSLTQQIAETLVKRTEDDQAQRDQLAGIVTDMKVEREKTRILNEAHDKRWSNLRVRVITTCAVVGGATAMIGCVFATINFLSGS